MFLEDTEVNRNLLRGYVITTEAVLVNYLLEFAVYLVIIGYCIDLITTIQYPLDNYVGRTTNMFRGVILSCILYFLYTMMILLIFTALADEINDQTYSLLVYKYIAPIRVIADYFVLYYGAKALINSVRGILLRDGFNKDIQKNIFKTQVIIIALLMLYNIPYVYKFTNLLLLVYKLNSVPGIDVFEFPIQQSMGSRIYLAFF